jgi:hypothetical protein
MHRASKVLLLVGVFLVVSVLWPYDPTTDTSDAVHLSSRPTITFAQFEPPSYLVFEDRWFGASTKLIFTDTVTVLPNVPVRLAVPPGRTILPGTEYLVLSHDIRTVEGAAGDAHLAFVGANGSGWEVPLAGPTTTIKVYEEMNDWAPDPNTRWTFVLSTDKGPMTLNGLRLDIQRLETDLPDLVEYDDGWDDQDVVRIHSQRGELYDARVGPGEPGFEARTGAPVVSTPPDHPTIKRVPARDVAELHVELTYNSTTDSNLHYNPTLFFRAANVQGSGWTEQGLPPTIQKRAEEGGRFVWHLPIGPEMWDSPFAAQTRWQVAVNWRGESTDRPVYMSGDYNFWIDVIKTPDA